MKWKGVIAGVLPLLLVIGAWGAWQYRQYRSYQTLVPGEATTLIRIHVDGLIKDIGLNVFWNRSYYDSIGRDGGGGTDLQVWRNTGASIPANLFLFQMEHAQSEIFPDVYFGSVGLTDTAAFSAALRTHFAMQVTRDANEEAIAVADRAIVVYSADRACFALSLRKPAHDMVLLQDVLHSLLAANGHLPVSESKFRTVKQLGGHIGLLGNYRASIRFNAGEARGTIALPAAVSRLAAGGIPDFPDSNAASFWLNGTVGDWLDDKQFGIGGHTLHVDSLLRHYRGNVALEWRGTVMQTDTIISYDYDEDFVLQERQELIGKPVPELYLSVAADSGLIRYLAAQGIVDLKENSVNPAVLPLYQVNTGAPVDGYVQWYTARHPTVLREGRDAGDEALYVRIDFNRLNSQTLPIALIPYIQMLDNFEATGRMAGDTHLEVVGKVRMKNWKINSLVQLLAVGDGS